MGKRHSLAADKGKQDFFDQSMYMLHSVLVSSILRRGSEPAAGGLED